MLFQLGLYNAINAMDAVLPHASLRGPFAPHERGLGKLRLESRLHLAHASARAQALPEVESVAPLYIGFVLLEEDPQTGYSKVALALAAFDPSHNPFKPGAILLEPDRQAPGSPEAVLFEIRAVLVGLWPDRSTLPGKRAVHCPLEIDKTHAGKSRACPHMARRWPLPPTW